MKIFPTNYLSLSLVALITILCSFMCSNQEKTNQMKPKKRLKTADKISKDGYKIVAAPIVQTSFINKKGLATDKKEYYLRRSIQDYYIKLCESKITEEELTAHLTTIKSDIKVLKLEIEYKKGEWDNCEEIPEIVQSRIGEYVIIHKIL